MQIAVSPPETAAKHPAFKQILASERQWFSREPNKIPAIICSGKFVTDTSNRFFRFEEQANKTLRPKAPRRSSCRIDRTLRDADQKKVDHAIKILSTERSSPPSGFCWFTRLTLKDAQSFGSEQRSQGTVNHILDSTMDIVANIYGMNIGYLQPGPAGVNNAIRFGNYIPGPSDYGEGHSYQGDPSDAWGPYW